MISAAVLAAVSLLALQGCAPAAPAEAVTSTAPVLSLPTAEHAYQSYLTASDAAAAIGDQQLALAVVTGVQWTQVKSQYTALATQGTPVPRYRYGTPRFYVPALAGYPEWFLVAVPRQTDAGGHLSAPVNTLMLFTRADTKAIWSLSGSAVLDQPLPPLAADRNGYAVDVSTTDPSLLMRPDVVGATQAAVVDEGLASPAAAVVGGGSQTTGLYAAQAAQARSQTARGLQYQWLLQGVPYPQFQLRTADGGALTLYGMFLDVTTEHPNLAAGPPIPIPAAAVPVLAAPDEIGRHSVYVNWTYEFAAIDPPQTASSAKVQVIGGTGAPTYGHPY